ncbi:helix-turn-helix domain-containing protein [Christensenella timonensis]|uniref:helix-turn-helix domain-containing protein n=1 Tax=Christensenella timonensis TaxID=1816678 RepID=UPI00082EF505|nr:helix-turn-helix transcriptional regulator [Christensenella timonensis]
MIDYRYDKEIGKQIAKFRIQANMTQEDLSAQLQTKGCDLTRSAVAKIEAGQRHIYTGEIKAIKEVLKVSYEDLFV